jgi:hypothetical protein
MGVSSFFTYALTFLSAMAIMTLAIGVWGYYSQPPGNSDVLLPNATIVLLNDYFQYIVVLSLIIVIGEWTYKRPKKRKYEGEEYVSLPRDRDEDQPPFR